MAHVDSSFFWALGLTFVQTVLLAASGGVLGMCLASVVKKGGWPNIAIPFFLRLLSWLPFFLFFLLPSRPNDTVLIGFICGAVAVGLHTSSCLHSLWAANPVERGDFNYSVVRSTILHALLFCLFMQIRAHNGWVYVFHQQPEPGILFAAVILLVVFCLFVERLSQYDLEADGRSSLAVIKAELDINGFLLSLILISIGIVYFILLHVTGDYPKPISSPNLSVDDWFFYLIRSESTAGSVWQDLFVSSIEVLSGLLLSWGLSFYASKVLSNESWLTRLIVQLVAASFVIAITLPMLLPFFGINRLGQLSLSTILSIGLLTLFPFLRVTKALQGEHALMAMMVGLRIALPLACVGMFVGELYGAVAGLGFRITSELASGQPVAAMAVSFITLIALLLSIFTLHWASVLARLSTSSDG